MSFCFHLSAEAMVLKEIMKHAQQACPKSRPSHRSITSGRIVHGLENVLFLAHRHKQNKQIIISLLNSWWQHFATCHQTSNNHSSSGCVMLWGLGRCTLPSQRCIQLYKTCSDPTTVMATACKKRKLIMKNAASRKVGNCNILLIYTINNF